MGDRKTVAERELERFAKEFEEFQANYPKGLAMSAKNDFDRATPDVQEKIRTSALVNIRMVYLFGTGHAQWCGQPLFKDCVGGVHAGQYIPLGAEKCLTL